MADDLGKNLDIAKELSAELLKQVDLLDEIGKKNVAAALGQKDLVAHAEKTAAFYIQHNSDLQSINQLHANILEKIQLENRQMERATELAELGAEKVSAPFESFRGFIEGLPGGDFLSAHLGLGDLGERLESTFQEGMVNSLRTGKLEMSAFGGVAKEAMAALVNPLTIAVVLLALAAKRFAEIDASMREIRANTGFTGENLQEMSDFSERISRHHANLGIDLEKSREITEALVNQFGTLSALTAKNADMVARLMVGIGLSADESAKLLQTYENLAAISGDTADNLLATTKLFADQNDVAPKAVMQDIAEASDQIFASTDGVASHLIEAAVEARKLGLSLSQVAEISESLMEFESSIEREMQAMVLTGQQLNLEQARYYALVGDSAGVLREMRSQIGDYETVSRMLPFQKKALAEAIGLSSAELLEMLRREEALADLADGTKDSFEALQEGASLEEVLGARGVLTPMEELGNSVKALIVSLSDVLLPVIKTLVPIFRVLAFVLDIVAKLINLTITPLIEGLADVGQMVYSLVIPAFEAIYDFFSRIFSGESISEVFSDFVDTVKGFYQQIWDAFTEPFVSAWDFVFGNTIWSAETITEVFDNILGALRAIAEGIFNILVAPFEFVFDKIMGVADRVAGIVANVVQAATGGPEIVAGAPAGEPAAISAATEAAEIAEEAAETKGDNLEAIIEKMEEIIKVLKAGKVIEMDGRKVGAQIARATPTH